MENNIADKNDVVIATTTLSQIQRELNAPKNIHNSFGGFNYRSCEGILEALKPLMVKYDFAVILNDEIVAFNEALFVKATATFKMFSCEISTSAFAQLSELPKMSLAQATGAASSYARKYALNGLFAIDDNKDHDAYDFSQQDSVKTKKITSSQIVVIDMLVDNKEAMLSHYGVSKIEDLTHQQAEEIIKKKSKK